METQCELSLMIIQYSHGKDNRENHSNSHNTFLYKICFCLWFLNNTSFKYIVGILFDLSSKRFNNLNKDSRDNACEISFVIKYFFYNETKVGKHFSSK